MLGLGAHLVAAADFPDENPVLPFLVFRHDFFDPAPDRFFRFFERPRQRGHRDRLLEYDWHSEQRTRTSSVPSAVTLYWQLRSVRLSD